VLNDKWENINEDENKFTTMKFKDSIIRLFLIRSCNSSILIE